MNIPNLTLIGMPGAGKSTIGRLLAKKIAAHFIDGDDCIHQAFGISPQQIIDTHGEEYFLRFEKKLFMSEKIFVRRPFVFAPGGSVIYSDELMRHLLAYSTIIFLDVPFPEIERRLARSRPRGIIGLRNKTLKELYAERVKLYKMYAHHTLRCDRLSKEKTITKIHEILKESIKRDSRFVPRFVEPRKYSKALVKGP